MVSVFSSYSQEEGMVYFQYKKLFLLRLWKKTNFPVLNKMDIILCFFVCLFHKSCKKTKTNMLANLILSPHVLSDFISVMLNPFTTPEDINL